MSCRPIALFDSGVGGLTVVKSIQQHLPNEAIVYLGDTARVPYGTKSPEVVTQYALRCARFLLHQGAKCLVIACNTASSVALESIQSQLPIPVIGVVNPGAQQAARHTQGRVGVIGTRATIASEAYQQALRQLLPQVQVIPQICPLLVPLAEEGMVQHQATTLLLEEYLVPLQAANIDTLILGCTHYPLFKTNIEKIVGPQVQVIDSADAVATALTTLLKLHDIGRNPIPSPHIPPPKSTFFCTDHPKQFRAVGQTFLDIPLANVHHLDLTPADPTTQGARQPKHSPKHRSPAKTSHTS